MVTNIDGMPVAIREHGSGTAVVMIHGNSLCSESFDALWEAQGGPACRFIAPDLPGHGASKPASSDAVYSVPGYAEVVTKLLESLDLQRVVMIGHSLGGHVVLEMMGSARVAGAVIFGAPPLATAADVPRAFLPHPAMALAFKPELSPAEATELGAALAGERGELACSWILQTPRETRAALGQSLQSAHFADEVSIVRSYDRPLAVVHGENDPMVNRSYIEALEMPTLWRSAVQTIPATGHSPQLEQPEAFGALLRAFVSDAVG